MQVMESRGITMKNIDKELVDWAIQKIETEYKDDVALLIGQVGGCKIPTDEQNMIFDFFVPSTERGFQMANTFMIEEMGYDLFPISWDRLEGIANIEEPRMIFAFAKGEVIYARTPEDKKRYEMIKEQMFERLQDKVLMYGKALEQLETAQEIYQTMLFEEKFGKLRKAAGGVCCFLMSAIASLNGTYLKSGYMNLTKDLAGMALQPENFKNVFVQMLDATTTDEIRTFVYELIKTTRAFITQNHPSKQIHTNDTAVDLEELAFWYHEARYTFRRIEYYTGIGSVEDSYLLGCYLQIEFDAIQEDFGLKELDLMGVFNSKDLAAFANKAREIEDYLVAVLKEHKLTGHMYPDLAAFLEEN